MTIMFEIGNADDDEDDDNDDSDDSDVLNWVQVTGAGRQRPSVAGSHNQQPGEDDDKASDDKVDEGGDENDDDDTADGKDGGDCGDQGYDGDIGNQILIYKYQLRLPLPYGIWTQVFSINRNCQDDGAFDKDENGNSVDDADCCDAVLYCVLLTNLQGGY